VVGDGRDVLDWVGLSARGRRWMPAILLPAYVPLRLQANLTGCTATFVEENPSAALCYGVTGQGLPCQLLLLLLVVVYLYMSIYFSCVVLCTTYHVCIPSVRPTL
jgi:hypothetical protein